MKPFARINCQAVALRRLILVSSLALAAGCVSRIDLEHWTLEPCDAATTAEIARLVEEGASRDGRVWNDNGNRSISRMVNVYNLDAIISVGYRVNSARATQFRIWATKEMMVNLVMTFLA